MDDVLRTGPFHTALRSAIAARGLSLDRLRDRLAALGLPVSVSTLSNWQRGVSRPRGPDSLRAVAELAVMLDLPDRSLSRLLEEPVHRGRRPALFPGTPRLPANRLRTTLGVSDEPVLEVLAKQDDVTVTETGWLVTSREVVRARRDGVGRHVVLSHTRSGELPEIRAGRDSTLGRVCTDPDAALVATELLFAPLGRGETFALEYQVAARAPESYYGRWLSTAGQHIELTLRIAPGVGARRAYRIWRLDGLSPHKDVARLRLIDGKLAHMADFDVAPGFHGIRWTR